MDVPPSRASEIDEGAVGRELRQLGGARSGAHPAPAGPSGARRSRLGLFAIAVFGALTAIAVGGLLFTVTAFVAFSQGLDDPRHLNDIPLSADTVVLDRTGTTELARFGTVHREPVKFEDIPAVLIDATTAVEDKSFWTNPGFDPLAIASAALDTLRGNGRGASTITQQLVRQRLLKPDLVQNPNRKLERKLKELVQSIRLTQAFPGEDGKREIMTAYLNQNYYGNSDYGVKAAARDYFGIEDLSRLSLAQAALLAAIPQSPTSFDLVRNAVEQDDGTLEVPPDTDVVQRRNFILDLMAQGRTPLSGSRYTAADFAAAKEEPVIVAQQSEGRWTAPHFVWAVRDELARRLCGEDVPSCPALEQGGYRVITTLDMTLQAAAEKWVKAAAVVPRAKDPKATAKELGLTYEPWMQHLRAKDVNNGALVALDYETGEIVAYVGSADYYAAKASRQFQPKFDVLADGWRQPGSAFKPFNYVTGIEDRTLTPATMLMDVTTDFGGGYTPTDADNLERGPVRVRDALRFSLNIPSVKAAAVNGVDHVFAKAQQFGLRFRTETTGAGLSIALGTEEVHPVDLVTGYGTLANGGRHIGHTTILQILDGDGHDVVPAYAPPTGEQAVSAQAAYLVTDILAGNTDPKTNPFWGKFEIDASDGTRRPATLKTGTNNDARDLNAYGFIAPPDAAGRRDGEYALAVGAWNGNSDNSVVSTPDNPVFSIDVTTYVWQGFMQEVTAAWPVRDFARPDGLVEAKVDPWTGLQPGRGGKSVTELFIAGTEPGERVPSVEASAPPASPAGSDGAIGESASPAGGEAPSPSSARTGTNSGCAEAVLAAVGYESRFAPWLAADRAWLARAVRGPGVAGGPERTRTAYFYNGQFRPYGASWGPFSGIGCLRAAPSPPPTESPSPCPPDVGAPGDSPSPADSAAPIASSGAPCLPAASPSPLASASPSPSESPSPSPSPGATPTPVPTAVETPPPTAPPPTAPPPPAPTPPPAAPATPAAPAASPTP